MKSILSIVTTLCALVSAVPTAQPVAAPPVHDLEVRASNVTAKPEYSSIQPAPYGPYYLASYYDSGCYQYQDQEIYYKNTCKRLNRPLRSLEFYANGDVPYGCTLYGLLSADCSGSYYLAASYPVYTGSCYKAQYTYSPNQYIYSVLLYCQY